MLRLEFSVYGVRQLDRALSRFGDEVKDFRPAWRSIRGDFLSIEREQWATAGARGNLAWPPLSPTYAAWKAMHYPGLGMLVLHGELKSQMTTGHGMTEDIQPLFMKLHPTLERARWHQTGVPPRLPARKVVMLNPGDKVRWVKMLHEFVEQAARKIRGL